MKYSQIFHSKELEKKFKMTQNIFVTRGNVQRVDEMALFWAVGSYPSASNAVSIAQPTGHNNSINKMLVLLKLALIFTK